MVHYFGKLGASARTYFNKGGAGDTMFRKFQHTASGVSRAVGSIAPHITGVVGVLDPTLGRISTIGANLIGNGAGALGYGIEQGRRALHNALERAPAPADVPKIKFH
jgi:hypothetical protein